MKVETIISQVLQHYAGILLCYVYGAMLFIYTKEPGNPNQSSHVFFYDTSRFERIRTLLSNSVKQY